MRSSSERKQGRSGPLHFAPLYDDQGLVVSAWPDGGAVRVSCRDATDRVTATGVIN